MTQSHILTCKILVRAFPLGYADLLWLQKLSDAC
uniref:Uncharacterized protein n=1 Tax=Arundo donax TaxID=35708 RepID=A0A0A9BYX0_ARUDO